MFESFQSYRVKHPLLEEHIAYVYFEHYEDKEFVRKYSFYPHVYTCISCYRNVHGFYDNKVFHVQHKERTEPLLRLTQQRSIHTGSQTGPIDKIAIVFKPLGLNHFIRESYIQVASEEIQEFIPGNSGLWKKMVEECFAEQNPDKRVELIEAFLLAQYQPKDILILNEVLKLLSNVSNDATIEDISNRFEIPKRTLLRSFKRELGMSPEMYRRICRFRHAVNKKLIKNTSESLTSLAYDSGFSDQSFMNRTFKKFTHCTPKQFFALGIRLGSEDTFWRIH